MTIDHFAIRFLIFAVGTIGVYVIIRWILSRLARSTDTDLDDVAARLIEVPILPLGLAISIWQAAIAPSWWGPITGNGAFLVRLLIVGSVVAVLWRMITQVLDQVAEVRSENTKSKTDDVVAPIVTRNLLPTLLVLATVMAMFWVFGGSIAAGLATAGGLSFLLVFLLQEPLSNLFGGLSLAMDTPFVYDDLVILEDGKTYAVQEIGARVTRLYDIAEHNHVYVPNVSLTSQRLINLVRPSAEKRQQITVGVAYDSDIEKILKVLADIAERHPHVLSNPTEQTQAHVRAEVANGVTEAFRIDAEHLVRQSAEKLIRRLQLATNQVQLLEQRGISKEEQVRIRALLDRLDRTHGELRVAIARWVFVRGILKVGYGDDTFDLDSRFPLQRLDELADRFALGYEYDDEGVTRMGLMGTSPPSREAPLAANTFAALIAQGSPSEGTIGSSSEQADEWLEQFRHWDTYLEFDKFYRVWHKPLFDISNSLRKVSESVHEGKARQAVRVHKMLAEVETYVQETLPLGLSPRREPSAAVSALGASAIEITLDFYVDDVSDDYFDRLGNVVDEIYRKIVTEFNENDISMPFPQLSIVGVSDRVAESKARHDD